MRARRGARKAIDERLAQLGKELQLIAYARGFTSEDLRAFLQGDFDSEKIDAYLNGGERPEWKFVAALLKVVVPDDRWNRELLERQIRPLWISTDTTKPVPRVDQGGLEADLDSTPTQPVVARTRFSQAFGRHGSVRVNLRFATTAGLCAAIAVAVALIVIHFVFNAEVYTWARATGGPVASSPWVANGTVYVGSGDGRVYALNATTGHVLWSYTTGDLFGPALR